jgi:hypothetical protein
MFWLRKVVPEPLRAIVGKRELIASLGTHDCAEAKLKAGPVLARFEAILAAARNGGGKVSDDDIKRLCEEWYRAELARCWDEPGDPSGWEAYSDHLYDQLERFDDPESENDPHVERGVLLKPEDRTEAAELLQHHGYHTDDAAVTRTAEALYRAKWALCNAMMKRAKAVAAEMRAAKAPIFPETPVASPMPLSASSERPLKVAERVPETAPTAVPMLALVSAWAAESGTTGKALYDRERTAVNFAQFLGHDDAARVTAEDVVAWKEARLKAGRSTKTVANDIGELRPIWTWGKRNRKLTFVENPFSGLAPKTKGPSGINCFA